MDSRRQAIIAILLCVFIAACAVMIYYAMSDTSGSRIIAPGQSDQTVEV